MRHQLFLLSILTSICLQVSAQSKFPADVARFIEKRDGCDHFRGEEPYDEERRKFLLDNITALCTGSDNKLAQLKKKYAGRPDVIGKLNEYELRIETGRKNP
ncbi:hypothetical protein [Herminiimonas arsenitoxidans]|uniref:hypothetical protein n=1 Tax=Herminiimonas arsenitoxidans TaxID=1809410 RepID=UPI0009709888|nr:hypothetical protein [Herminiimonas arsenitoxidans]